MSRQSWELGRAMEAVTIARAALEATRTGRDPRLSALLHGRMALGYADELLSHRSEERSHLLVEPDHRKVRALYEQWGYQWMGVMQPYADAPRYDSLLRPLGH
jgi:hypothetical protein